MLEPIDLGQRLPDILLRINDIVTAFNALQQNVTDVTAEVIPPFTFLQPQASDVWTIDHNFPRRPVVTVFDDTGDLIWADIDYPSDTQVTVSFSGANAGYAILN